MKKIKTATLQGKWTGDAESNNRWYKEQALALKGQGIDLIVLPEMFHTPYFPFEENADFFDMAIKKDSPLVQEWQGIAKEVGAVIVFPFFEKRARGIYHNSAFVFERDGSIAGLYRKSHIPDDPAFYEKYYFIPGDTGFEPIKTSAGTLGVLICWDQWYPEASRITALKGAQILFYPTAIGWDVRQKEHDNREQYAAWQTIQRSHAVANGVPVVSVNRTGREGGMQFWGGSFVTNAFGRVLWQAPHYDEALHIQTLDLDETDHYRRHWPYLRDRRIDSYGDITKRYID